MSFFPDVWIDIADRFAAQRKPSSEMTARGMCPGSIEHVQDLVSGGRLQIERLDHTVQLTSETIGGLCRLILQELVTHDIYAGSRFKLDIEEHFDRGLELCLMFQHKGVRREYRTIREKWIIPDQLCDDDVPHLLPIRTLETIKRTFEENIIPQEAAESWIHPDEIIERKEDFVGIFGTTPNRVSAAQIVATIERAKSYRPTLEYVVKLAQPYVIEDLRDRYLHKGSWNFPDKSATRRADRLTLKDPTVRQRIAAAYHQIVG